MPATRSTGLPRLMIVGDEAGRTLVREAASGLAMSIEERADASMGDLRGVRLAVVCGLGRASDLAEMRARGDDVVVVAALRGTDAALLAGSSVDDFVSLDAPAREIAARLGFAAARAAASHAAEIEGVRLTEVADVVDDLIAISSADGRRNLFLSAAFETITGTPREPVLDDPAHYLGLVHPDDHSLLREAHMQRHQPHEYRYRIIRADGQTRWLHTRAFPTAREGGAPTRVITVTRDVTARKSAEDDAEAQRRLIEGVTSALTTLLAAASPSESIDRALAILGPAALVDRVYIARHHRDDADELRVAVRHEWVSEETTPSLGTDVGGERPALPEARPLLAMLERGQTVELVRSELPPAMRERLDPSGVRSMLVVPIVADGACWGHVGFVDCHAERRWDATARATLEATAAAVGSTIMRERAMEALAEQLHRVRSLFESAANPALTARDQLDRLLEVGVRLHRVRSLFESAANPALTARDQLDRLLEVGVRLLGVDVAAVLRIRPEDTETCEATHVHPATTPMQPGERVPLTRDLWEISIAENRPMAVADAVGTRYEDAPAHRDRGFRSFLGAPLWVRGHAWGGLAFLGMERHPQAFRDTDLDLARLVASGVSHLLEQIEAQEERAALELRFRETQKLESLGLLAGGIAHDFNNMLMGIMGHAAVATRAASEEAAIVRESLEQITAITQRAAGLTRQLLAYAGRDRVRIQPMSLSGLVREMSELLAVVLPKDARLENQLPVDLPAVLGDSAQLQQVVMNLITNASDALAGGAGVITLRAWVIDADALPAAGRFVAEDTRVERYAVLEVNDTGRGMGPETLEHVFEPFFTTKGPGRGLGLAAVLGIVRSHHGALDVESTPDVGTTFRLFLPIADHAPEPAHAKPESPAGRRLAVRVLVVDDTDQVRKTVERVLTMHGAEVLTARDGVEAVEVVERERERVDVVVLDLTMPRMDGAKAHERIREIVPGLPILLMSGYAEGEQVEHVLSQPRTRFLAKPFDMAELLRALRELLAE